MAYVPQDAIDIFSKAEVPGWQDVYNAGVENLSGVPCSARTAQRWFLDWRRQQADSLFRGRQPNADVRKTESDMHVHVVSDSATIKTLNDLLEVCDVDLDLWEVDRWHIKPYQAARSKVSKNLSFDGGKITGNLIDDGDFTVVTMYSVEAWFKRRVDAPISQALETLLEKITEKTSSRPILVPQRPAGRYVFLPGYFDIHVGRLPLHFQNTPAQTRRELETVNRVMLERVMSMGVNLHRILFVLGNDFFHVDSLANTTTRGTWQEVSANLRVMIDEGCTAAAEMIEQMLELAPVDVVTVPGNHDRLMSYWLGKYVQAYFRNNPHVEVTLNHGPRSYKQYGVNLIGMEHGDRVKAQKLPILMAEEAGESWYQTKYRTWLRGHFHQEQEVVHVVDGFGSVSIVTFPAFCPPSEWEAVMGYQGGHRAAEGRLYHMDHGPAGVFPVFVEEVHGLEGDR